jgi:thiosulfate/3-mercaptopyruvate sulfurtransferase
MRVIASSVLLTIIFLTASPGQAETAAADDGPAASIPAAALIQPAELAARLRDAAAPKPVILQVGFRILYKESHIPGSEYVGPAREEAGLHLLRGRVAKLARDSQIVIYCGCCPWQHCPNVAAAYDALHAMGFTHVTVLHIANNFNDDWVKQGYPAEHG